VTQRSDKKVTQKQSENQEHPRKVVPPVYAALSVLAMYLLDRFIPIGYLGGPFVWGFASAFIAAGLMFIIYSAGLFKKAETPLIPFHKSTAVVTTGPYCYPHRHSHFIWKLTAISGDTRIHFCYPNPVYCR